MEEFEIELLGGKKFIIPETAIIQHRKVHGDKIKSIKSLNPVAPPPAAAIKLPSSTDEGITVAKAKEALANYNVIAQIEAYVNGDTRKGIIAAAEERIEELQLKD